MSRFRYRQERSSAPESPEAVFRDLRPRDRQVRDLYLRQGDILRAYHEQDPTPADVALELPTGAGKTLVGLLIAEWRRRALAQRVAYLCPTVQLARQAARKAAAYGLDVVTLVRRQAEWPETDWTRFIRGQAVAISTYHAVFNSNPRLDSAQTLILDDAHAGEGPVAEMWSIRASRDNDLYRAVLSILREALPASMGERLDDDDVEGTRRRLVELVPPLALRDKASELKAAMAAHCEDRNAYVFGTIADNLPSCMLYMSWQEMLLRPLVAPTATHAPFSDADQRIYMSATLGSAGELERAFGVGRIVRPHLPTREDERGFGRRLFLMPGACQSSKQADATIAAAIRRAGRAVLLTQSNTALDELIDATVSEDVTVVSADEIERDSRTFTEADQAVLALANRYDGIDLPDQACRLIVMSGLPRGAHLQERFLSERLEAGRVIDERVRTRLTQGAGRCTRNPQDFAAVLLRGADLIDFLSRDEQIFALRPEIQAEVEFGLTNSGEADTDFLGLLNDMLERTEEWSTADDYIRRDAAGRSRQLPADSQALAAAAPLEVACWQTVWRGDLRRAVTLAQQVVDALSGGEETRPYRALWLYLAASWARANGEDGDQEQLELAEQLQSEAEKAAERLPWVPRHPERMDQEPVNEQDPRSVRAASQLSELGIRGVRFEERVGHLMRHLRSDDAADFEEGLLRLGHLLGFEAIRPRGDAAPDGAWRSDGLWLVWEAKTAERADAPLSVAAVRQAETHARWLERDGAWRRPARVLTLIVSPKTSVDPAAVQVASDQRLVATRLVRRIAEETVDAYREVRGAARGLDDHGRSRAFATAFGTRRLSTAELVARLAKRRIADD